MSRRASLLLLLTISASLLMHTGCGKKKRVLRRIPPVITTTALPDGVLGQPYGPAQLTATGTATPYTWNEIRSNLGTYGLSLNLDGTITGTPTEAGICNFTAKVTGSSAPLRQTTKPLSISIFGIMTRTLPDGAAWQSYGPELLTATGGTTPYTWSEAGNSLGTYGLTLDSDGAITGTLGQIGTCSFTAEVTDSSSPAQSAQKELTISIYGRPFASWGDTNWDEVWGVAVDSSGNIYCASRTFSFGAGSSEALLLKYNASGALQWAKTWGGTDYDCLHGVAVDSGGGIYCTGITGSFGVLSAEALLLKYNASGALQWAKTWGGTDYDCLYGVAVDSGGSVYCAGITRSFGAGKYDALLLKYDASGALQWVKTWGGTDYDCLYGVAVDSGGNIYCAGRTSSFGAGDNDALLLKYDASGALQWAKTWGGTDYDCLHGVAVDSGGGIYCAGDTDSFGVVSSDALLLKHDASGALQWARTWGGTDYDCLHGVTVDSGGSIYCAGVTGSFGAGSTDALILDYDSSGALQWAKTWGGTDYDCLYGVAVDSGGNLYSGGTTCSYASAWQTITTGTERSPSGTQGTSSGSESLPTGTEGSPSGAQGSPVGSETGAGKSDTLLLKNWR